jgi:hypothetical protein
MSGETEAARAAAGQMEMLAGHLRSRGLVAQVMRADGKLCVRVVNRIAAELSQLVYAAPIADGSWWFWWSWADRIASVSEIETATFKIAYVLTPTS